MTVVYPGKNYEEIENENNPQHAEYDLQSEKERIAEGTEEIKKELTEKWKKRYRDVPIFPNAVSGLNPNLVNYLLSFKNTLFYNDLAKKFGLNSDQRDEISQIVWKICLNKQWDQAETAIRSKFNLNPDIISRLIDLLKQNILREAKKLAESGSSPARNLYGRETKEEGKLIRLPLAQALKDFPELEYQKITNNLLRLKNAEYPVQPTIKNWVADFYQHVGVGNHSLVERSNYVFQSENGDKLTYGEQQKLALILKSLAENMPLDIDPEGQKIIFPAVASESPRPEIRKPEAPKAESKNLAPKPRPSFSDLSPVPAKSPAAGDIKPKSGSFFSFGSADLRNSKPVPPKSEPSPPKVETSPPKVETSPPRVETSPPKREHGLPKDSPFFSKAGTQKTASINNVSDVEFSSAHKFPAEKGSPPPAPRKDESAYRIYPIGGNKV